MVRVGLGVGVKLGDTQAHSKMGCACASHFDIRMRISFWGAHTQLFGAHVSLRISLSAKL